MTRGFLIRTRLAALLWAFLSVLIVDVVAGSAQAQTNPHCQYGPYYNPALCPVDPPAASYSYQTYNYSIQVVATKPEVEALRKL